MSDPRAASGYIVELFEVEPLIQVGDHDALGFHRAVATLQSVFQEGGPGLVATLLPSPGGVPAIEVILTGSRDPPRIEDRRLVRPAAERIVAPVHIDRNVERHELFLRRLADHPLVRRIRSPILIEATEAESGDAPKAFPAIGRVGDGRYPKIGVIDTGVDGPMIAWVLDRHDFLDMSACDPTHGTMVAGVLVGARAANGPALGAEDDGCDIVDLALMPRVPFLDVYGQRGFEAFLEELEAAITEAKNVTASVFSICR